MNLQPTCPIYFRSRSELLTLSPSTCTDLCRLTSRIFQIDTQAAAALVRNPERRLWAAKSAAVYPAAAVRRLTISDTDGSVSAGPTRPVTRLRNTAPFADAGAGQPGLNVRRWVETAADGGEHPAARAALQYRQQILPRQPSLEHKHLEHKHPEHKQEAGHRRTVRHRGATTIGAKIGPGRDIGCEVCAFAARWRGAGEPWGVGR